MKRRIPAAVMMTAALLLGGCTVEIDNHNSDGELLYRSSRPDDSSKPAETHEQIVGEPPAEFDEETAAESGIIMPEDNTLTVLIGDDHEKLLEACNNCFESLGGELTVEVADSDLLYDSIAKGKISDKPIDVATFDNGMLFPYLAVNGVAAPIDHEIEMPKLSGELKKAADLFSVNNWHYVLPLGYEQAYRLLYDTKTIEKYKLDDPGFIPEKDWTLEKLCKMAENYHEQGGEFPLSGNYGEPVHIAAGKALAVFERDPAGLYNNLFDPDLAETTDQLFQLKEKDITMDKTFESPKKALEEGTLFYAATLFEAQKEELPDTVKSVAVPTLKGLDRHYELKVYGLTLMEKSEHKGAAECYFKCAAEYAEASYPEETVSADYRLQSLDKTVYPYDKGISLGVSYSPAHKNEDMSLAVSPLIYSGLENKEDWGGVCAYYSRLFINDCTELNNNMRKNIYGD